MSSGIRVGLSAVVTAFLLWFIRDRLNFDPETYTAHFADQQTHLGIANFWNVVTNAGFVFLGVAGLRTLARFPESYRALGTVFAAAVLGTGFGSAYFHYEPTPTRLFWDQLPMSIGFASFTGMVIADRVCERTGLILGALLCLAGPWSVWNIYYGNGATEYYLALQFGALIFAILVLTTTRGGKMKTSLIFVGLVAYIVAKVLETYDAQVFTSLAIISGHSLKHVAASLALWAIFRGTQARA